ncbi:hypothetical protein N7466_001492 [Penicillium verhagenii]|uniref:uncharacterized protein n=1 Tax=Penicillium verhagenii TaxID=1562060 RepID=UPI00254562CB|nr:uncharacterized protein N7466_001492 [Penicillium verhagenii]KAJ5938358.1 hypothetical protein N7466_001492 [Penicillium verhagenii]
MDENTRSFLAQALRDALAACGIDDEGYIDSFISQFDDYVLRAHRATARGNLEESRLRSSSSVNQKPAATSNQGLGIHRPLQPRKRKYAIQTGAANAKKQSSKTAKQKTAGRFKESGDISTTFHTFDRDPAIAGFQAPISYSVDQEENHQLVEAYTTNYEKAYLSPVLQGQCSEHPVAEPPVALPVSDFPSYQSDSAYTVKALAIDPIKIRNYVDEIAEYDYEKAVRTVRKDTALTMGRSVQSRCNETIFWKIILKGAALVDEATLPSAKGPADGFTMAEKAATKNFMAVAGYGLGAENQRQHRIFWKALFQMREAGIEKVLYYRTKEFDSYCKGYPKTAEISLVDTIMSWETQYRPFIEQLETRVLRLERGDMARFCDLESPRVMERLEVSKSSWNNAGNNWASIKEQESFQNQYRHALPAEFLLESHNHQFLVPEFEQDKSLFVFLVPQGIMALSVCSIVPVCEGDLLGIFAGSVRFSEEFNVENGICSPIDNLWLDYSQITGTLNQMQVSEPGAPANVRLHWNVIDEDLGTNHYTSWRVSVRATRPIRPFFPLIRATSKHEQYDMHLSPDNAKRAFLARCKDD